MKSTRRNLLQGASLLGIWPFSKLSFAGRMTSGVYQQLGIRPVINCRGTHTVIGASKIWPEIHDAMAEASRQFVELDDLQDKVGARLSALIGCEDAMVTTGCAGAITLGSCAAVTGMDAAKVRQLPNLTGTKTEAIIQKIHRNGYDHAVRNAGLKIVEVEGKDQLRNVVSERTAMMYFLGAESFDYEWTTDPVSLEDCLELGRKAGFPVQVAAAG